LDPVTKAPFRPLIAVMGAGAVGSYFGGILSRSGVPVTLITRAAHVEAIRASGLRIESVADPSSPLDVRIPIAATVEAEAIRTAAIVLFCVKTIDTEDAARAIRPFLAKGAVVLSLQNGVDNVERIRAAAGIDAVPAAVYVAVSMPAPGHVRHTGRGDLRIGAAPPEIVSLFTGAGIPCLVSDDIDADLWAKLLINCAYNPVSAVVRERYGRLVAEPEAREIMRCVVKEGLAVAGAAGIRMPEPEDFLDSVFRLADSMPEAISSTAQDLARGRRTEIDALNGYVARRARSLGIDVPVNRTLTALVKILERGRA
jgi:2-dehydropantoate 2-reductase